MNTIKRLRSMKCVAFVDDERDIDNGVIVTLKPGWFFVSDTGCGVRGFGTPTEALRGCKSSEVYYDNAE